MDLIGLEKIVIIPVLAFSIFAISFSTHYAQASSILELIGGDPSFIPNCKSLDPNAIFSPNANTCDVHNIMISKGQTLQIGSGVTLIVENSFTNNGEVHIDGTIDFSAGSSLINNGVVNLNGAGSPLNGAGVSINGQGVSINGGTLDINGQGVSLNGAGAPVNGQGVSLNGAGAPVNGQGVSINGAGASITGAGININGAGASINGGGISVNGAGVPSNGAGISINGEGVYINGGTLALNNIGLTINNSHIIMIGNSKETITGDSTVIVAGDSKETVNGDETVTITGNNNEVVNGKETITIHGSRTETVNGNENIVINGQRTETVDHDETITIHGERTETVNGNEKITVHHDRTETVDKDETITVSGQRTETVDHNENITVHGNRSETVDKDETITIHHDRTETVDKDETITVSGHRTETVDKNETITVGGQRTETVSPGGTITISSHRTETVGSGTTITVAKGGNLIINKGTRLSNEGVIEIGGLMTNNGKVENLNSIIAVCGGTFSGNPPSGNPVQVICLGPPQVTVLASPTPAVVGTIETLSETITDPSCKTCTPASFSYAWTLVAPTGSSATLSSTTAQNPTFTPDLSGSYQVSLIVTDALGDSSSPSVFTISTAASKLVYTAGTDQTLTAGMVSSAITVQMQDSAGNPVNAPAGGTTVNLASTPSGGQFSALSSPFTPVTSVLMQAESNSISYFFKHSDGGHTIIIASSPGLTSASTTFTVIASAALILTPNSGPVGSVTSASVSGFASGETVTISFGGTTVGSCSADGSGSCTSIITVPPSPFGAHTVTATGTTSGETASATFTVIPSIILSLNSGPPGIQVTLNGDGFDAGAQVEIDFTESSPLVLSVPTADSSGHITGTLVIPAIATAPFSATINAHEPSNPTVSASAPFSVTVPTIPPQVTISSSPPAPAVGDQVTFTANINDPGCATCVVPTSFSYQWSLTSKPAGSAASLSSTSDPSPTFTPDLPGNNYQVSVMVTDSLGHSSAPAFETIQVSDCGTCIPVVSPSVLPNPDAVGIPATLNANPSDAGCNACIPQFAYHWQITSAPPGSTAILSSPSAQNPTITPDLSGIYQFSVSATDTTGLSSQLGTVTLDVFTPLTGVTISDTSPATGVPVQLAAHPQCGSGSCGTSETFSYQWSFSSIPAGSTATINNPNSASPAFVPDYLGLYTVHLLLTDQFGNTVIAADPITVSSGNCPPGTIDIGGVCIPTS